MKEEQLSPVSPHRPNSLFQFRNRTIIAAVIFCATSTLIAVRRPTVPHVFPLPAFDQEFAESLDEKEFSRAQQAHKNGLSHSARVIGELARRVGAQLAQNGSASGELLHDLHQSTHTLVNAGRLEEIRDLRALQSELFVQALHRYRRSGQVDSDLQELGGGFLHVIKDSWLDADGNFLLTRPELRLMFRAHFNRLTDLEKTPQLGLNLEELRRYYSLLMEFPPAPSQDAAARAQLRLGYARALGAVDPTYNSGLAAGIAALQLGQPGHAEAELHAYLENSDVPYRHQAEGHYLFALRLSALALSP